MRDHPGSVTSLSQPESDGSRCSRPPAVRVGPENAPANALGMRRIMFAVSDINDVVSRLRKHGGELVGEIAQYENVYRLCFMRGPEGILIGLAERLGDQTA